MPLPRSGAKSPAFTLLHGDGKKVSLRPFEGKKIVAVRSYPRVMTPGCTVQACGVRDADDVLTRARENN